MKETEIGKDLELAKKILKSGRLVAIPTETVYGLAANALDQKAVSRIFEAKNRPTFDPLIIHVGAIEEFKTYVKNVSKELLDIAIHFCPGPLTFLIEKQTNIPDLVTSGLSKVAIRIPNHPLSLSLLKSIDFPLAAPSANPFGYISPTNAAHVYDQLNKKVDYILDGGQCEVGLESTIIGFEKNKLVVYRKGGLAIESIKEVFNGEIVIKNHSSSHPEAPGMLKKHYAPNKKMSVFSSSKEISGDISKIGFLGFNRFLAELPLENQFILSQDSSLKEAASRLFLGLRWLDSLEIDTVYIEMLPEIGLGMAINDRLRRASATD